MVLRVDAFTRNLAVLRRGLEPAALKSALAAAARESVAAAVAGGEGSPAYETFVNGRRGAREDEVELPGPILYVFSWLNEIATFAVGYLETRYPVRGPEKGGHYVSAHRVLVNGRNWDGKGAIPFDAELTVVNTQPYARKVQVGARGFSLSKGLYDDARQALLRRFSGLVDVDLRFIKLRDGYVLRGRGTRRKDSQAGQPLGYPALIINRRLD